MYVCLKYDTEEKCRTKMLLLLLFLTFSHLIWTAAEWTGSFSLVISVHTHHQFNFVCRYYFCIWPSSSGYRSKRAHSFFHSILGLDNYYHNIPVYNYQLCIWYLCSSCLHTFAHSFFHDILGHNNYPNISVYNHQLCIKPFCNGGRCRFARSFFLGIHTH